MELACWLAIVPSLRRRNASSTIHFGYGGFLIDENGKMKKTITVILIFAFVAGCAVAPATKPLSPVDQYWINRTKAEAAEKSKHVEVETVVNKTSGDPVLTPKKESAKPAEPDSRTPIERYHGDTAGSLAMCKEQFRYFTLTGTREALNDFSNCTHEGENKAKESLKSALKTIKLTKAQDALKSYHVAFMTALKGLWADTEETKIGYEQRQRALYEKVTEAWERFNIEN